MKTKQALQSLILSMALSAGCTPTRVEEKPDSVSAPRDWLNAPDNLTVSGPVDLKAWWQGFQDPVLNAMIAQALSQNHDIRIALARIREAKAIDVIAESALYPSLGLFTATGGGRRIDQIVGVPGNQGIALMSPTIETVSGGLAAHWELDLFGARHLEMEAAAAQAAGGEEALHAAQVALLAQLATDYLQLRGINQRIGLLAENINLQRERLKVLQAFMPAGKTNGWDIARQKTLLHSTEAALPALKTTAASLSNRLAVLLGQAPEQADGLWLQSGPMPQDLPTLPRLIPASLLEQRPDLRLARTQVKAMAASLGAARADIYPKLVLSTNAGFGALAASGFPSLAESIYNLGTGLTLPLFNAGRIQARIAASDSRLEQVALNYEKTLLLALEDVENAYTGYSSAMEYAKSLSQAETGAEKTCEFADALYRSGAQDYLAVLDARRHRLLVKDELAKANTVTRVALVSLYRAFGGGWGVE